MDGRAATARDRRRPIGAEPGGGGTSFRVWAGGRERVSVVQDGGAEWRLDPEAGGYFSGRAEGVGAGARYRFRLDADERLYPDPASRFQPDGPHGPSEVVDPSAFRWTDQDWPGIRLGDRVISEIHVGTFTPEGTWAAAAAKLPHLAETGINTIEMMPVADFPGRFGWGYDGVNMFAPTRLYGRPDDLRAFIDSAHRLGIGVILDVVYNHLGPDGNYLACFSRDYFTDRYENEWGQAINFDGDNHAAVREFFIANAAYWIDEFHFDGLRLDATQSIFDSSPTHILAEIATAGREAAGKRSVIFVAENEPQETRLVRPRERGGFGLDALWNDDLHHSAAVVLTGRSEAYYEDHRGEPQEFISAAKRGYLFQGQVYAHQGKRRGTPGLDLEPTAFVTFTENHDQIANTASGARIHTLSHPAAARAVTALMLLMPGTPMLFQGQEFWSSNPFFYFCDFEGELGELVRNGRVEFLSQFPSIEADPKVQARLADPGDASTFERSKINWADAEARADVLALHRDLLRLRREDPVMTGSRRTDIDGAVLSADSFALRWFGQHADRLLLVNLGRDLVRRSFPEPLVAPPANGAWSVLWSSEDVDYGGSGTPVVESATGWRLPAFSAVLLGSASSSREATSKR